MKKLPKQNLNDLFAAISAQQALYLPADDAAGQAQFTLWHDGMTLSRRAQYRALGKGPLFSAGGESCRFPARGKSH